MHFSGHGGPGTLVFEDEYGEEKPVKIDELITEIRRRAPERLPRFFFLACCHGGDAPSQGGGGLPATATALHVDGITQVVGYFGPVLDELSTRAERAFYAELAAGSADARRRPRRPAGDEQRRRLAAGARRAARCRRRRAGRHASLRLGADGALPARPGLPARHQRSPPAPASRSRRPSGARLTAYPGSRSQILKAGFVGRRKEMHALRRDLREGRHLHVVQGTGGLGKSAFCNEALKVYARLGWQPLALWCADVEGAADPVAGLVRQVEAAGRAARRRSLGDVLATARALRGTAAGVPAAGGPPAAARTAAARSADPAAGGLPR